jgi:hypothetical protein
MRYGRGESLDMWTIYDHPRDFPNSYVARLFQVEAGKSGATETIIVNDDLELIRKEFESCGLVCIIRADDDDPVILETWL